MRMVRRNPAEYLTPEKAEQEWLDGSNRILAVLIDGVVCVRNVDADRWYSLNGAYDYGDDELPDEYHLFEDHHDFAKWLLTVEVEQ